MPQNFSVTGGVDMVTTSATLVGVGMISEKLNDSANASASFIANHAGFMDSNNWVSGLIGAFIEKVFTILSDPASLLHWTASEWAMLHGLLRHSAIILIHLTPTGFH